MKSETASKLHSLVQSQRIKFTDVEEGLSIDYNLSDEELKELVELEYGATEQSIEELFKVLCKKLVKLALEQYHV